MRHKIQRRYVAVLLVPFAVAIALIAWLTLYTHGKGVDAMRQGVENTNLRVAESTVASLNTQMEEIRLNAINLAIQIDKVHTSSAYRLALYHSTIDQMTYLQLNAASLLNPLVNRGYVFLFDEDRAITQSSATLSGSELYEQNFRFLNTDYASFKDYFTRQCLTGSVMAEVPVGYQDEVYTTWAMVQSIPAAPTQVPRGVIVYTLDQNAMRQRLGEALADETSLSLWQDESGKIVFCQGADHRWDDDGMAALLAALPEAAEGALSLRLDDGQEYLVTVASGRNGRMVTAQSAANAFSALRSYNASMLLLALGMLILAVGVAVIVARRNIHSVQQVMNSVAPQNRDDDAANVFEYMQSAILSAQQKEAILSARADQQREVIRNIFLKRFLRGEYASAADLLREQHLTGLSLAARNYVVLLIHFVSPERKDEAAWRCAARITQDEFGREQALLVDMSQENLACLLLAEEPDLRESIEAVADSLAAELPVTVFASATVTELTDVPQAYREVRVMARTVKDAEQPLMWYSDLFPRDERNAFEYSLQMETRLCNHIAAGNRRETEEAFAELHEQGLHAGLQTPQFFRFFAYSLYRLVQLVENDGEDRRETQRRLQGLLDSDVEDPRVFDQFFGELCGYCLRVCDQGGSRSSGSSELLRQVVAHIDEHYTDPELSVSSVAGKFMITDKYLSQLFKEQTGGRLSAYIEGKRISHACQLLDTTEMTINEIALASGYALTHTFRVAFKKLQGVTPVQWKKTRREGQTHPEPEEP